MTDNSNAVAKKSLFSTMNLGVRREVIKFLLEGCRILSEAIGIGAKNLSSW